MDITWCEGYDWEDCAALGYFKRYMINLVQSLSITDDDFHVGVVIYGRSSSNTVTLESISQQDQIEEIAEIDYSDSFNLDRRYTHVALDDVQSMFNNGGRSEATRICILLTTGESYRDPGTAADYGDINILIFGIGIDPASDDAAKEEFEQLVHDEDSIYYPADLDDLILNYPQIPYDALCVEESE